MSGIFMNMKFASVFSLALWLSVFALAFSFPVYSQTIHQLIKAGDKKFSNQEFYAASLYYEDALQKDDENVEVWYKYAEAARLFNDYGGAATAYKSVVKLDKSNQFPLASFYAAEMLRGVCECKYEEALALYKKFRNRYRKQDYYLAKTQQQMESIAWANANSKPVDSIKIEHLGEEVNSEQSEFNAIHVFPDRLQFSSLRNIGTEKEEKYLARIYNQMPNPEKIFLPNGANENRSIANGTYAPDSKRFYFTQCETGVDGRNRCDIYVTKYDGFKWMPAEKLSDHVNDPVSSNTHPALAYDASGNEVLIFASDRNGGIGMMDIWMSKINSDGSYQQAINAGSSVNTKGNEVTPFYDVNNHKLYFASDWHYGFGGFDIFESSGEYTNWTTPKNLLQPVNTAQNDLYYSVALDYSKAYITSNRKGSYFIESETCCNDIYAYNTGRKITKRDTVITALNIDSPTVESPVATAKESPVFIDDKLKKVKQLLPVTLYFHNDEPGAKTLSDTTSLDYKQTYEAYSALRREYEREYARTLKKDERIAYEGSVKYLFEEKVDKGYYDLIAFASQTLNLLQGNNKLEITIQGYCSPLNYNEYNIHLGNRRVAALRNFFFHYRDGIFLPFIASGQLILKNESKGEETAPQGISDNREDKPNSVYNPKAALERRVEIISVELK
jgi:hypothetical protein